MRLGFDKSAFFSFVILVLFIVGTFVGIKYVGKITNLVSKASITTTPQSIQVVNITDATASLFWQTQDPSTGFVSWGDTANLGKTLLDDRDRDSGQPQKYRNHFVTFTKLTPKTKYYYTLAANDQIYNRDGFPYIFFTSAQVAGVSSGLLTGQSSGQQPLTARIVNTDQTAASDYFVTLVFEDATSNRLSSIVGALTGNDGSYTIDLNMLRSADGTTLFTLNPTTTYTVDVVALDEFGKNYTQTVTYLPTQPFPTITFGKSSVFDGPSVNGISPLLLPTATGSGQPNTSSQFNTLIFGATAASPASGSGLQTANTGSKSSPAPQSTLSPKSHQLLF